MFPNCIASPAIGVAPGALSTFREQTKTRISPRDQSRVAEDPFMQMRLAQAGAPIPLAQLASYRWDAAKGLDWSMRAVDRLLEASGGRGIFLDNPIQRAWRDVHAMRAHAGNNPEKAAAIFGRSEFGLPPLDLRF